MTEATEHTPRVHLKQVFFKSNLSACTLFVPDNWAPEALEYSDLKEGASLIAQLVKPPPAMQETPVRFLGWEDPLTKG